MSEGREDVPGWEIVTYLGIAFIVFTGMILYFWYMMCDYTYELVLHTNDEREDERAQRTPSVEEMGGLGHDFGHESVSEPVSEADL